ncbi:hypothetical protein [uncultured Treponema sp.]|nr:hypothetical protein [uncultured Treponema sp.]
MKVGRHLLPFDSAQGSRSAVPQFPNGQPLPSLTFVRSSPVARFAAAP